jgi:hypothetical protein
VTKEVTVGPWPEPPADKKKCVTSSTNSKQFNFFESNDTSKPPPAASKYSDSDAAFAYIGNLELSIQPRSRLPSGLQTRAKSGPRVEVLVKAEQDFYREKWQKRIEREKSSHLITL